MCVSNKVRAEMASQIERWPIERLVPYERNARTHSPQQIRKIADSIREFGFTNPILVDDKAGIIAGHARLSAARDLNLPEVPGHCPEPSVGNSKARLHPGRQSPRDGGRLG